MAAPVATMTVAVRVIFFQAVDLTDRWGGPNLRLRVGFEVAAAGLPPTPHPGNDDRAAHAIFRREPGGALAHEAWAGIFDWVGHRIDRRKGPVGIGRGYQNSRAWPDWPRPRLRREFTGRAARLRHPRRGLRGSITHCSQGKKHEAEQHQDGADDGRACHLCLQARIVPRRPTVAHRRAAVNVLAVHILAVHVFAVSWPAPRSRLEQPPWPTPHFPIRSPGAP